MGIWGRLGPGSVMAPPTGRGAGYARVWRPVRLPHGRESEVAGGAGAEAGADTGAAAGVGPGAAAAGTGVYWVRPTAGMANAARLSERCALLEIGGEGSCSIRRAHPGN